MNHPLTKNPHQYIFQFSREGFISISSFELSCLPCGQIPMNCIQYDLSYQNFSFHL